MDEKKVSLIPRISIFGSFKRINYKMADALAEIIDNSIDSFGEHSFQLIGEKLQVEVIYFYDEHNSENNFITIKDNAFGMNLEEITEALKLQGKTKHKIDYEKKRIGEYGLGLKHAATWLSNLWYVETTQKNIGKKHSAKVDIQEFVEEKNSDVKVFSEEHDRSQHYTIIKLSNLERKITKSSFNKIKERFQEIYGKKIYNQDLILKLTKSNITYPDREKKETYLIEAKQFKESHSTAYDRKTDQYYQWNYQDEIVVNNNIYSFSAYFALAKKILPIPGLRFFYKDRLIEVCYPSHVFTNYNPYRRIYGEIKISTNWPVAQTKDRLSWQGELEDFFWEKIKIFLKQPRAEFANKDIFQLADLIKTEISHKEKKTLIKKTLINDLIKNKNFFLLTKEKDSENNDDLEKNDDKIRATFHNPHTQKKEQLNIIFSKEKTSNQVIEIKEFYQTNVKKINLIIYLEHEFFHSFQKKNIKPEIQTLLIKLFYGFSYSLSAANQALKPTFLQLNDYLTSKKTS